MRAEIISIGTELLLGDIVDTNAAWLAQQLAAAGVDVFFRTTVGDNAGRIADAIRLAMNRADVVITSGGLGPTVDDVTREGAAEALGVELVLDPGLLEMVRARFARLGSKMSDNNVRQAFMPRGATPIENPVGTAPIFLAEKEGRYIFVLPGVPREMKYLAEKQVLPWLRAKLGDERVILSRVLRTAAVGESLIDSKIADLETSPNPTVGLAAHPGQTDVRITAKALTRAEAEQMIQDMEARIRERLGDWIYGVGNEKLEEVVARMLAARNWRLAIAESNTRGMLAERLLATPEGSLVLGPVTTMSDVETIGEEEARRRAERLLAESGANVALVVLSTLQYGESLYDEVKGETDIAVARSADSTSHHYTVGGTGEMAQQWVGVRALDLLRRELMASGSS